MWTSMLYLNFSNEGFLSLPAFSRFVTQVLSHRNNKTNVSSIKLSLCGKYGQVIVKRILKYAFSHNVQQMSVSVSEGVTYRICGRKIFVLPLCLLSSQSLKHLTLNGLTIYHSNAPSSTWDLPAVTTLHLNNVTLYDHASDKFSGLFSKCTNLENLSLKQCIIKGADGPSICHPQLSNLILEFGKSYVKQLKVVNMVAPKLKNISLALACYYYNNNNNNFPQFISYGLPSLENVDLLIRNPHKADAPKFVGLLQQFQSVKYLPLNLEIMEAIASSVELISNQPSPFANLKSLRIYPAEIYLVGQAPKRVNVSTEIKNYLLDSSPSATFTMVSREEIIAARNTTLAQKHMAELRVLLDQEKAKTNRAPMDHQKTPTESHKEKMHKHGKAQAENEGEQAGMKMPCHIGGKMARIQRCWKDLDVQIQLERAGDKRLLSKLEDIEELPTRLPASKRVKMEPCFSSLCAEANTVMNEAILRMKIRCDTKGSHLSVYFHKLAKALQSSS